MLIVVILHRLECAFVLIHVVIVISLYDRIVSCENTNYYLCKTWCIIVSEESQMVGIMGELSQIISPVQE